MWQRRCHAIKYIKMILTQCIWTTIRGLFKTTVNETYCQDSYNARINDGVVDEDYISNYSNYAEERINISNAIIYYDMIYKTDHGFSNNNMNSDNSSSGANSVFAPPENKRTFGRHAA